MGAAGASLFQEDPSLFCTSFKKQRFYIFSKREPALDGTGAQRDVFNEKPSKEDAAAAAGRAANQHL